MSVSDAEILTTVRDAEIRTTISEHARKFPIVYEHNFLGTIFLVEEVELLEPVHG